MKLVSEAGGDAIALTADVASKSEIDTAVRETVDHFGKLDIAWANAGVVSRGGVPPSVAGGEFVAFEDLTESDWQHVLGVNLSGVVYTAQAAVPHLKANGGGTILATSSAASMVAYHNIALYSATKAASTVSSVAWLLTWAAGGEFGSMPWPRRTVCRRTS